MPTLTRIKKSAGDDRQQEGTDAQTTSSNKYEKTAEDPISIRKYPKPRNGNRNR